jgi:hypothetical protein
MTTFAVTNSGEVIDGLNYVLSNLNLGNVSGNVTVPTGTLVANSVTGEITQFNVGGTVYGYVNQWVNLRYATNSTGTAGFSTVPTNATYFGVFNSTTPTPSSNPAAYVWREVAGGFGLTKTIYYSAIGGRQVLWAAASSPPSSNYVVSVANVAIDLDVVTTAAGTPGQRGPIAMAYVVTTADPATATSAQLTAWFEASRDALVPPIGTGLTPPVAGDTATFIYGAGVGTPSGAYSFNGSVWNLVTPQVISGNVIVANSLPGTAVTPASITGDRVAANTITGNLIQAATITGNLITANTITGNLVQVGTLTGNLIAANTITSTNIAANTITANNIAANTITATEISSSYIYAGNLVSIGANIGNNSSTGYWLQYQSGNARFGGNVSIGANLSVDGLITTGDLDANTVNTGQLVTNSATTVLFQTTPSGNTFNTVEYYNTGNVYWPDNTRAFAIPAVAIRPTTAGSISGSSILVSFTAGALAGNIASPYAPDYNLVELWRNGPSQTYSNVFSSIQLAAANNSSVTSNELMTIGGSNGVIGISTNGGDSWGFNTSGTLDIVDVPTIQVSNAGNSVIDVVSYGLVTSINNFGGTSGSWTFGLGGKLTSGRVLFTGQEVGTVNIDYDIGIITGYTAFAKVYRPFNFANPGPSPILEVELATPTGFFSDIYSMDWGYATTGNALVKNAVFSCTGGDILTTQFQYHTGNGAVTYSTVTKVSAPTDSNLFSVSADRGTAAPTTWIAVGEAGAIQRSTNSGASWTAIASPTANALRGVIGTGLDATKRFVAVGDGGTILMSQDGGITWTAPTVPTPTDGFVRNLYAVSFCPTGGTGNAGLWTAVGEGIIYNCDKTSTTWSIEYQEAAVTSNTMNRLVYIGSNFDVNENSITSNAQIIGNTVVTYNYQDTDYTDTNTYQYYLIVGNMQGGSSGSNLVTAKFPSLTVQEIKR